MNTNTVPTDLHNLPPTQTPTRVGRIGTAGAGKLRRALAALGLLCFMAASSQAATVLGPWKPVFQGIEHAVGTNTPGGGALLNLQVVNCLKIDLADPDIRLFASPRHTNYVANYTEAIGFTATNFLKTNNLQVAINANSFFLPGGAQPSYTLPEGTAFDITGLFISKGVVVSPQDNAESSCALLFTTNNGATFVPTNWPPVSTAGFQTAVSGLYPVLVNGLNVGSNYNVFVDPHGVEPRTAFGLSEDRRYLFLLVIDGRQPGYSDGAYDWETAIWMQLVGARDASNMDGGGSSCMIVMDTTGKPVPLNRDSATLASGRERTVGAQFGIYAKPVPGFFNDVTALPDDTAATISWTTIEPATTHLTYGLTTNLAQSTASNSTLVTSHAVLLTNLTRNTGYYFTTLGTTETTSHISPLYYFTTTNYVMATPLTALTNAWRYTRSNLDATNWTARSYDDSGWDGTGQGVLWADLRGPNASIPAELNTELPLNPGTGYPYTTYYFRTYFNFTNDPAGATLQVSGYFDDGAVFYLNGREIRRVRMAAAPTAIYNATAATAAPCSGDATCLDAFSVSGPIISTNLVAGQNVLAVEVHNRSAASADVTFGLSASLALPYTLYPTLNIAQTNSTVTMSWAQGGYTLQQASEPTGAWMEVPGPVVISPFTTNNPTGNVFYRLSK